MCGEAWHVRCGHSTLQILRLPLRLLLSLQLPFVKRLAPAASGLVAAAMQTVLLLGLSVARPRRQLVAASDSRLPTTSCLRWRQTLGTAPVSSLLEASTLLQGSCPRPGDPTFTLGLWQQ